MRPGEGKTKVEAGFHSRTCQPPVSAANGMKRLGSMNMAQGLDHSILDPIPSDIGHLINID
jgi:hypothetical protein